MPYNLQNEIKKTKFQSSHYKIYLDFFCKLLIVKINTFESRADMLHVAANSSPNSLREWQ